MIKNVCKSNEGQSVARNNGMKIAKGEFIGFCDNDDWVSENYFEDLYKAAIFYNEMQIDSKEEFKELVKKNSQSKK